MIIIMKRPRGSEECDAVDANIRAVCRVLKEAGFKSDLSQGVEVHPNPPQAIPDDEQPLTFEQFAALMTAARRVAEAIGRTIERHDDARYI